MKKTGINRTMIVLFILMTLAIVTAVGMITSDGGTACRTLISEDLGSLTTRTWTYDLSEHLRDEEWTHTQSLVRLSDDKEPITAAAFVTIAEERTSGEGLLNIQMEWTIDGETYWSGHQHALPDPGGGSPLVTRVRTALTVGETEPTVWVQGDARITMDFRISPETRRTGDGTVTITLDSVDLRPYQCPFE